MCSGEVMRSAVSLALALFVLALMGAPASEAARPKQTNEFASADQILRWINGYRTHPQPDKVPAMVKAVSAVGLFRDLETAGVYVGFMAGVIDSNPTRRKI